MDPAWRYWLGGKTLWTARFGALPSQHSRYPTSTSSFSSEPGIEDGALAAVPDGLDGRRPGGARASWANGRAPGPPETTLEQGNLFQTLLVRTEYSAPRWAPLGSELLLKPQPRARRGTSRHRRLPRPRRRGPRPVVVCGRRPASTAPAMPLLDLRGSVLRSTLPADTGPLGFMNHPPVTSQLETKTRRLISPPRFSLTSGSS